MSDQGALPPAKPQPTAQPSVLLARGDVQGRIINATGDLRNVPRPTRVEGTVLGQNNDGSVRVRTESGDVDIILRTRDIPPEGQKVQVDVPAGRPPRQAVIRPAPEAPPEQKPVNQTQAPPRTDAPRPAPQTNAPAPSSPAPVQTPVAQTPPPPRLSQTVSSELAQKPVTAPPPEIPVRIGDVVRLLPLPPAQADKIIAPPVQIATEAALKAVLTQILSLPLTVKDVAQAITTTTSLPATQITPHKTGQLPVPSFLPASTAASPQAILTGALFDPALSGAPVSQAPSADTPDGIIPQKLSFLPASITQATTSSLSSTPSAQPTTPGQIPVGITDTSPEGLITTPAQGKINTTTIPQGTQPAAPSLLDVKITNISTPAPLLHTAAPEEMIQTSMTGLTGKTSLTPETAPHHFINKNDTTTMLVDSPSKQAGTITAHVIGKTATNLPVLALDMAGMDWSENFVLQVSASNLPTGSRLELLPQTNISSPAVLAPITARPLTSLDTLYSLLGNFEWPALDEMMDTLDQINPQIVRTLTSTVIPNAAMPDKIPAAMLLFIAAVRGGDIGGWLGDKTIDTLRRAGKSDTANKVAKDFDGLTRLSSDSVSQDWRATAIPLFYQNEMQKMMLYYRNDGGGDGTDEDKKRGSRFIFDLNLNRMGAVQLDGLHRMQDDKLSRMDLIVRTHTHLSPVMQQSMRRLYTNALEQANIHGELSFQNRPDQWVKVQVAAPKETTVI